MAKILVCLVGCLAVGASARAEEPQRRQLDTAEAFRQCSIAQKVDPRTLTAAGKEAAKWCLGLGMAYEDGDTINESGQPIPANYALAARYYKIACNLTVVLGCISIGQMNENGRAPVPKGQQLLEAARWYTKGCYTADADKTDVALSCSVAGDAVMKTAMAAKGRAVPKGIKLGIEMLERACQLGHDGSCRELVSIEQLSSGTSTPPSRVPPKR
jgi:TPR repeat protein